MAKKTWRHFIVIAPTVLACHNQRPTVNPPYEGPPISYGPRMDNGDGTCYVSISGNPPQQAPVSCTAPIEKTESGACIVASAEDPARKVGVACEP